MKGKGEGEGGVRVRYEAGSWARVMKVSVKRDYGRYKTPFLSILSTHSENQGSMVG